MPMRCCHRRSSSPRRGPAASANGDATDDDRWHIVGTAPPVAASDNGDAVKCTAVKRIEVEAAGVNITIRTVGCSCQASRPVAPLGDGQIDRKPTPRLTGGYRRGAAPLLSAEHCPDFHEGRACDCRRVYTTQKAKGTRYHESYGCSGAIVWVPLCEAKRLGLTQCLRCSAKELAEPS